MSHLDKSSHYCRMLDNRDLGAFKLHNFKFLLEPSRMETRGNGFQQTLIPTPT